MIKTKMTKAQILRFIAEKEANAWDGYKLFKGSSEPVAAIFKEEWLQMHRLLRDLEGGIANYDDSMKRAVYNPSAIG